MCTNWIEPKSVLQPHLCCKCQDHPASICKSCQYLLRPFWIIQTGGQEPPLQRGALSLDCQQIPSPWCSHLLSKGARQATKDWVPDQSRELASVRKRPQTCWSLRWKETKWDQTWQTFRMKGMTGYDARNVSISLTNECPTSCVHSRLKSVETGAHKMPGENEEQHQKLFWEGESCAQPTTRYGQLVKHIKLGANKQTSGANRSHTKAMKPQTTTS